MIVNTPLQWRNQQLVLQIKWWVHNSMFTTWIICTRYCNDSRMTWIILRVSNNKTRYRIYATQIYARLMNGKITTYDLQKFPFFHVNVTNISRCSVLYYDVINSESSVKMFRNSSTPWVKKVHHRVFVKTSLNIDPFSQFFHRHTLRKICNKVIINDPTTPEMRRYTTLWNINVRQLACAVRWGSLAER